MRTLILILLTFFFGCGKTSNNYYRTVYLYCNSNSDCSNKLNTTVGLDEYKPVSNVTIEVTKKGEHLAFRFLRSLNPVKELYAVDRVNTITYISTEAGTINLDLNNFILTENNDGTILSYGFIKVDHLIVNKLKICGSDGKQKCSEAVIRAYTNALPGFAGIQGFVNITDNYGVELYAGKGPADKLVGLGADNAAILQTYTIPNEDHKLTIVDFPSPNYNFSSNFSNAGYGNYKMELVIEAAVR